MGRITGHSYKYFSSDLNNISRGIVVGDFQWVPQSLNKRNAYNIKKIEGLIKKSKPNFIIIPGDLVESIMYLKEKRNQDEFLDTMKRVTDERATFWIGGNHDNGMINIEGKWQSSNEGVEIVRNVLSKALNMYYVGEKGGVSLADAMIVGKDFSPTNINISGIEFPIQYYIEQKECLESYLFHLKSSIEVQKENFCQNDGLNICLLHDVRKLIMLGKKAQIPTDLMSALQDIDFLIGGHNHNLGIPNIVAELLGGNAGLFSPSGELFPTDGRGTQYILGIETMQVGHINFTPSNKPLDLIWGHNPWGNIVEFMPQHNRSQIGLIKQPQRYYRALVKSNKTGN